MTWRVKYDIHISIIATILLILIAVGSMVGIMKLWPGETRHNNHNSNIPVEPVIDSNRTLDGKVVKKD